MKKENNQNALRVLGVILSLVCLLCVLCGGSSAQTNARSEFGGNAAPVGNCFVSGARFSQVYVNYATGDHYNCVGTAGTNTGVWVLNGTAGGATPGGSNTQVQFNDSGAFGGDTGFVYNKTTNAVSEVNNGIGATSTDGVVLQNATAAANGAQQWSPRLRLSGQGFRSTGSLSRTLDWVIENQTVQSSVTPSGQLTFFPMLNGTPGAPQLVLDSVLGPTFPTMAGGGNRVLVVNNNGILSATANAGITNSAGANVVPKSDGTNLIASQISDDGNSVIAGQSSGSQFSTNESTGIATISAGTRVDVNSKGGSTKLGDLDGVGNSTTLTVDDAAQTVTINKTFNTADVLPSFAAGAGVGSAALPYLNLTIGNAANNSSQITGTFTGNRVATVPDVTGTFNLAVSSVNTGAVTTDQASNLTVNGGIAPAGTYRIDVYIEVTIANTTGTLAVTIGWTDDVAARTATNGANGMPLTLSTATTTFAQGSTVIRTAGAAHITYNFDVTQTSGTATFRAIAVLTKLL